MEDRLITEAYLNSKIVMMGDYPYFVNTISDGNPPMTRDLLDEIVGGFQRLSDLDCDVLLAPETMGIPYGAALTMRTGIPFQIIRKRRLGVEGEVAIEKTTGYETSTMYVHGLEKGSKAIIVDDVVSTGNTLKALVEVLRKNEVEIEEALIVLNKCRDISVLEKEIGINIRTLIDVSVEDGKPVIKSSTRDSLF